MLEESPKNLYGLENIEQISNNNLFLQITLLIVLILLLITSAIISGSETAYTSLNLAKIENMLEKKEKGAKLIKKHYLSFNQTLSTILFVNNLVNIGSSALTSYILGIWIGANSQLIPIISTAILTPIIVVFSEIFPKLIAKSHTVGFLKFAVYFIHFWYILTYPITFFISKLGKKVLVTNSEEEIKSMLNIANDEGVLETKEAKLTQNALDLDSTKVLSHYIRLKDVSFIESSANIKEALNIFNETQYSRLPIRKNNKFIGIVLLKDIFLLKQGKVINYLKKIPNVTVNMSLSKALEKMRLNRSQMAFVTQNNTSDEVKGIITIEDILEELVGEIYDEYDTDEEIYEISLEKSRANGDVDIKTLFKQLEIEIELSDEESDMELANWITLKNGHKLNKTEKFIYQEEISFKVIKSGKTNQTTIYEINIL
ncbi:hemolysin family protein [Mycoplasma zalophi]|uniref:hemolysin family protein n=1 Tax=Mycoplasma zalophi TaxID=191287 RepID=UPI0021C97BBE|nr:hemolysin family protein [Mycoplasma zalophi]MCU4116979.1 hemolysin family protein [Mycoplasma zalophi]